MFPNELKTLCEAAIPYWAVAAIGLGPSCFAQPVLSDDPRRPVAEISRSLGVEAAQFKACFAQVSPAPAGQRPDTQRAHANKAVLLACLQQANPAITNDTLDATMDQYRPGGREAQMPSAR